MKLFGWRSGRNREGETSGLAAGSAAGDPAEGGEELAVAPPSVEIGIDPDTVPGGAEAEDGDALRDRVIDVLRTCFDPEIPVDIYELGLVYEIDIDPSRVVTITMTLTSPACPVAGSLPEEVESKVRSVPGVMDARVLVVWDPPWDQEMMSEAARLTLGFF
ncbi:MAG: DUF59 domain-containing protein [Candidatus Schekmanbacteria bacterium]|nr:DUF59 domain-containing protein [Candidatus Schekmanbacteria bacterium]